MYEQGNQLCLEDRNDLTIARIVACEDMNVAGKLPIIVPEEGILLSPHLSRGVLRNLAQKYAGTTAVHMLKSDNQAEKNRLMWELAAEEILEPIGNPD